MDERDINFCSGNIEAKPEINDQDHKENKEILNKLDSKLDVCVVDITTVKTKSSIFGAIGELLLVSYSLYF